MTLLLDEKRSKIFGHDSTPSLPPPQLHITFCVIANLVMNSDIFKGHHQGKKKVYFRALPNYREGPNLLDLFSSSIGV